jgi:hypothetical protein
LVNNKQDQTLPKNKVKKYFGKQLTLPKNKEKYFGINNNISNGEKIHVI